MSFFAEITHTSLQASPPQEEGSDWNGWLAWAGDQ